MKISVFLTVQFCFVMAVCWQCPCWEKNTWAITSKTLHYFKSISVTLEYFDVIISVTSCAVLSQQKEQKVWSNKAVFPFDYSTCYIEITLMQNTHWNAVIWAQLFGKFTNPLNDTFVHRSLPLNKLTALLYSRFTSIEFLEKKLLKSTK